MKKEILHVLHVLHVSLAVALCANGLAAPAAADDGLAATPPSGVVPYAGPSLRTLSLYDAFVEFASSIATGQKAPADRGAAPTVAPAASVELPTPAAPRRAAPVARSYPRSFSTYDALVEYANGIAAAQQVKNDQLAAVMAREDAAREALAAVFDPRVRGGLRSRADLIDNETLNALR